MQDIQALRDKIDETITAWLLANGLKQKQIDSLDYSFIDNELNDLLNN